MINNYDLFQDFLEANQLKYGILATCGLSETGDGDGDRDNAINSGGEEEKSSIESLKKLCRRNGNKRISFSHLFENLNQLVSEDSSSATGIYLNLNCQQSENILQLASSNKLFNSTQKWLVVWERKREQELNNGESEVMKILENLDINLNSNFNIAVEG